jgi:hypothetical protein
MPIVIPVSSPSTTQTQNNISHVVQDVINATSQDLRKQLSASGSDATILIDYASRIHTQMLRTSRWPFLLSDPQLFITKMQVTDYWIGATGGNTAGSFDTGLNITDMYAIKDDTVLDRSNNVSLSRVLYQPPNFTTFEYQDGSSRPLRPTNFYHHLYTGILNLYPAADNQSGFQPTPESPICTTTVSGALAARTYSVRITLVDSTGAESSPSVNSTVIYVPANSVLVVNSPKLPLTGSSRAVSYSNYKVYAALKGNLETLQSTSITTGSTFTEPNGGLVAGAAAPTINNLTPLDGYVIEFRYWRKRVPLTTTNQLLQIPDDYFDVLVAGVNMMGFQYLEVPEQAGSWAEFYKQGLKEMVRDKNQFTQDFMKPDLSTQNFPPAVMPGFITGN